MKNNTKQRAMHLFASAMLLSLIGVGVANAAWTGNSTYNLGQSINGNLSVKISPIYQTINYSIGTAEVQQTYCSYFIGINGTTTAFVQGTPEILYGNTYTHIFNYTPSSSGTYIIGTVCQFTKNTFVNGAWTGWTSFNGYINESTEKIIIYPVSTSAPSTSPNILQFWSKILDEWIQSLIASL